MFTRDQAGLWTQQAYIKASTIDAIAGPGDQFGFSIDLDGNQADASVTQAGAAYLFARDGNGVWSQQTYVKASNTDALDGFGLSVALDGASSVIAAPGEASVATGINGD